MKRRDVASSLIIIVDAGFVAWGAMAAGLPDRLSGPGGLSIIAAGYEGFTKASWSALLATSPTTAGYIQVLFRTYGMFNVAFGVLGIAIAFTAFRRGDRWAWWALLLGNTLALVSAMTYDRLVNAIGPFEMSEYVGLIMIYVAVLLANPFRVKSGVSHIAPQSA
jgi:hypothetical protein